MIGIWLGNDDNSPTRSSSALAASLWGEIVRGAGRRADTMKLPARPLALDRSSALLVLVLTGIVLQAVNQLLWQLSYWLPGWLVGPLLLLLLAVLAAGAGAVRLALVAGQGRWPSSRSGRPHDPRPPSNRREAAERNLASIEQTLERVRDEVEREALRQERQRMAGGTGTGGSGDRGVRQWLLPARPP